MNLVDPIRDERSNEIISLNKVANERGKEDATRRLVSPFTIMVRISLIIFN